MQHFVPITPEDLDKVRFTIDVFTRLRDDDAPVLMLYGLTKNAIVRKAAQVCIQADREDEREVPVPDVAVEVPLTAETLKRLDTGIALDYEWRFASFTGPKGAEALNFWGLTYPTKYKAPTVKLADFTQMALAETDAYTLDAFMDKYGTRPVYTKAETGDGREHPAGEVIPPPRKQPTPSTRPAPNAIDHFLRT